MHAWSKALLTVHSPTCLQARNSAGKVGYVPEKYLLFLDSVSREGPASDGNSQEGSSDMALERELTSIMSMDLMLEPGGVSC